MSIEHSKSMASNANAESLIDLARALSRQTDFDEILRIVSQQAASLLRAESATILMLNPHSRETVKTVRREGEVLHDGKFSFVTRQISGWMMHANQPLLSEDLKADARFSKVKWGDMAIKSALGVLLKIEETVIGSIILLNKTGDEEFVEDDLAYLDAFAIIATPYLRNVQEIRRYFQAPLSDEVLISKYQGAGMLGKCERYLELLKATEAAAKCDVRALLEGQSGTGKELIARAIHKFSDRSANPFIAIDCGAIPENLVESELFGHVKGAFTGAATERQGLMAAAHGGTLFIDEIANLPLPMQTKLMRALQENEIRPLGSNKPRKIDLRIISASSAFLQELMSAGKFREDLFYRLYVYPIKVPALAERSADIPLLAHHFLKRVAQQQGKKTTGFAPQLVEFIKSRAWEGNIRELENFVERVVAVTPPEALTIESAMLPGDLKEEFGDFQSSRSSPQYRKPLNEQLAEFEERVLRQTLEQLNWHQSRAAQALGLSEQNLRYRMKRLGITRPSQ